MKRGGVEDGGRLRAGWKMGGGEFGGGLGIREN